MNKTGKKRPLKECLGENWSSNELRHKRRRFENIVLLRDGTTSQNNDDLIERRYYEDGESANSSPRRILRAGGKRKKPTEVVDDNNSLVTLNKQAESASNENDIINDLAKEFKKARLRPVFFTISSFVEQTVDEVGFTMADEPAEVTIRLTLPNKNNTKESTEIDGTIAVTVATATEDDNRCNVVGTTQYATILASNFDEHNIHFDEMQEKKTCSSQLPFSSSVIPVENAREGI